jgi:hypothetical protein
MARESGTSVTQNTPLVVFRPGYNASRSTTKKVAAKTRSKVIIDAPK